MSLAPWWAAVPDAALDDGFSRDRAAAAAASAVECDDAVQAMRRKAEAEMKRILEEMPADQMPRA